MRLQAYLAKSGYGSRRKCELLIQEGKVKLNNQPAKIGSNYNTGDIVTVSNKPVKPAKKIYLMLNKPAGYLCARTDLRGRKTVFDLLDFPENIKNGLITVGRLDYDTTGLLLITNDGDWANRLAHPRYRKEKTYVARIKGHVKKDIIQNIRKGVQVEAEQDGKHIEYMARAKFAKMLGRGKDYSVIQLKLTEGRKREVRRMLFALGHEVIKLERTNFGKYKLDTLSEGKYKNIKP